MDCLALREHVGMLLVARLRWSEPLQGSTVFGGLNANAQFDTGSRWVDLSFGQMDGKRAAVRFLSL